MSQPLASWRLPYLPIRVGIQGETYEIEALVDTGFDGAVILPQGLVSRQPPDGDLPWYLGDGTLTVAPYYLGSVSIGTYCSFPALITVLGSEALVGRAATDRFRLILDHGQRVIVEP